MFRYLFGVFCIVKTGKKHNIIGCCAADPLPFSLGELLGGKRYFSLWVMKLDRFTCCEIESSWMRISQTK